MTPATAILMADYNRWMNTRLYDAAASLPEARAKPTGPLVQHYFNHQTHHRGQASTLLFQAGVDVGVTDLLALIPDAPC